MTGRDRSVLIVVIVVAVLGAAWILVVSPERQRANQLGVQVTEAAARLSTAEGQLANARAAQSHYAAAYSSIVSLGKAVPASQEVPSLIYQLAQASNRKNVEFSSIVSGSAASSGASASGAGAAGAATAGFTKMPFSFIFNGNFFALEQLFQRLTSFTTRTAAGALRVSGRLLTIQGVTLTPLGSVIEQRKGVTGSLTGTIAATAYVLPAGQGLTGGASAASPVPAAASASSASSPVAPAIAKVNP